MCGSRFNAAARRAPLPYAIPAPYFDRSSRKIDRRRAIEKLHFGLMCCVRFYITLRVAKDAAEADCLAAATRIAGCGNVRGALDV